MYENVKNGYRKFHHSAPGVLLKGEAKTKPKTDDCRRFREQVGENMRISLLLGLVSDHSISSNTGFKVHTK